MCILPNFVGIGAAKAGTTSLYHYLAGHPDVFMSPLAEPKFFQFSCGAEADLNGPGDKDANKHAIRNIFEYRALFHRSGSAKAVGEISPSYLYYPGVARAMAELIPNAKILVVLRHPVDRAYSNYAHLFASGRETSTTFEKGLAAERSRISARWEYFWHYKNQGFYFRDLAPFFEVYGGEQIKVILYDELRADLEACLNTVQAFLGVTLDPARSESNRIIHNPTQTVRFPWIYNSIRLKSPFKSFLKRALPAAIRKKVREQGVALSLASNRRRMRKATKAFLLNEYRADIEALELLIERDLSHWKNIESLDF